MNMLKKMIVWLFSSSTTEVAKKEENMPVFLLPETAEEYRQLLAEKTSAYEAEKARYEAARNALFAKADAVENRGGNAAQEELNRREAEKIRTEARSVRRNREVDFSRKEIEQTSRQREIDKVAFQGRILSSVKEDVTYSDRNYFTIHERRVVEYQERYFLALLEYREITRDTGRTETRRTGSGYRGRWGETWEVLERTGDYAPPTVLWCTDALEQFTGEELRSITQEV